MYEYTEADLDEMGWERFVTSAWESIFLGYRRFTGVRKLGRRWSDLLQGGLGCSQELADELVYAEIMQNESRMALSSKNAAVLLAAMDEVLADMGADIAEMDLVRPGDRSRLLAEHARLRGYLRDSSLGS
jgi:hypothetical protein